MKGKILIEGLKLHSSIGVYEHEKKERQQLLVDLTLVVDISQAARSDHLEGSIDYDQVAVLCHKIVQERHYHLIESLAYEIMQRVDQTFHPLAIQVVLKKRKAIAEADGVALILQKGTL